MPGVLTKTLVCAIIKLRLTKGRRFIMMAKIRAKNRVGKAIFGLIFGMISVFSGFAPMMMGATPVYAEPEDVVEALEDGEITEEDLEEALEEASEEGVDGEGGEEEKKVAEKTCKESLGALGWLVCPATGTIAKAVDWLYEKIEDVLVINPVEIKDGSPIYEVWKYIKGITNVLFIIFLLIMVYSQITGLGITNYGLKKTLPKLIVGAIVVNLSFVICSLAVDVSNIIGGSLRGVFTAIEESTMQTMATSESLHLSMSDMYASLAAGTGFAGVAGVILFETGAIWMMIPTALGALVAVVVGLITIALRQAVVAVLIMIAPMAIVAYILPNTDKWFQQWKQLLIRMLVFYPMFSLLFGASSLAGWAIITSAKDGFWLLLGVAVQIFPLFFSWKMMSMSGTFLSNINAKMHSLAARPLATNRAWAESRRELSRQRYLASNKVYTPSLKLAQFVSNRRVAREEELNEHATTVKNRGLAYAAKRNYKHGDLYGAPSKAGEEAYEAQARNAVYQQEILRHKNNMNKGFGYLAPKGTAQRARLDWLDDYTVRSFDRLKMEQARTEKIDYDNAVGFHKRMEDAMNAHFDEINWEKRDKDGKLVYKRHFESQQAQPYLDGLARYNDAAKIMEDNKVDIQYTAAFAAHAYDTQNKIYQTKLQKYFELTPPTRDVEYRLGEMSKGKDAIKNIDAIIAGMRVLNQRGDTDLVREHLQNVLDHGVDLGTHASQSLASFLMFDVSDNDPFLKRFGKYINLETANVYNKNNRKNATVTMAEYVTGEHEEPDGTIMYAKRPMKVLLEGTSLDKIERTAMKDLDDILKATYTKDGKLDVRKYLAKRDEIETAIGPQFISASLKYLSGSEQLKSAVSFLTGFSLEQQKDENGKVMLDDNGDVVYGLKARWGEGGDLAEDADFAERYFRRKTEQYFKDQTASQLYGFRTDYRDPAAEHLLKALFEDHPELQSAYEAELADIQTRYGDEDPKQAAKKRKDDIKKLRMRYTGERVRDILDKSGKLEQMYRTRRSGAANNSKDWFRDWLLLNDEDEILSYLDQKQQDRYYEKTGKRPPKSSEGAFDGGGDSEFLSLYSQKDRVTLHKELEKIYVQAEDDESFYKMSRDKLIELLGSNRLITRLYEQFRSEVEHADKDTLAEELDKLIGNPENYDA